MDSRPSSSGRPVGLCRAIHASRTITGRRLNTPLRAHLSDNWTEAHPHTNGTFPSGSWYTGFDQHDLGDDNLIDDPELTGLAYDPSSTSPCIDAGFDGDWNGDQSYGLDDEDEAEDQGFPVEHISPWPTLVDFDLNTARPHEDGWDIGAQENH